MAEADTAIKPKTTVEKQSVFRGNWQPTIYKPVFGAYQFLPTPLPQEPRKKKVEEEEKPPSPKESDSPRKKVRDSAEIQPRERLSGKFRRRSSTYLQDI
jgi:hypothetical protein